MLQSSSHMTKWCSCSVPHTTPVASTRSIISSQEARWCSSIIDATRMRSGYSFLSCCNSANIVSNGRSLMSSIFSHPITSDFVPAGAHAFNFAYLGVTFTTFSESSDTWIENKRQLLDDDELPPPPYTEILETLRSAESWIPIPMELTHNRYIISSNLRNQFARRVWCWIPMTLQQNDCIRACC